METKVNLNAIYAPSEDIVAREIEGELIMIPITSEVGDLGDEIFTLNETGRAVWDNLNGKQSLKAIAGRISSKFNAPVAKIEKDIMGLVGELLKKKMVVRA